jgi:hypothetical protein
MRLLERFFARHKRLRDLAEQVKDGSLEKSKNYSLDFIFQQVRTRYPQALFELKKQLEQFRLSIVLNMTESSQDMRIAESMQKLVKNKCFLDIGILGTIPLDGLTIQQINAVFNTTPRLRPSFQKILNVMLA